jgi:quercetin dioxygenase-like cupin family protein
MTRVPLGASFEDDRGVIQDLIATPASPITSVTRIHTKQGAVRGNHVHKLTTQWTYVITGNLCVTNGHGDVFLGPGEMVVHEPGEPHAWKATQDTDCIVITCGPRAGEDYETDTFRLDRPLIA